MTFLKNLWAWLAIAESNFVAGPGKYALPALAVFVLGCLGAGLVRTFKLGRGTGGELLSEPTDEKAEARAAESLSMAIRIPSVTGDPEAMAQMGDFLRERYPEVFEHLNFISTAQGSIVLRWRGEKSSEKQPLLLCGHMDVVPPGDGWQEDPFSGRVENGYINGRGAIDCKNVVIGLMEAVRGLISEGFTPSRDIYLAFGHDEETGGAEGAASIAEAFKRRGLTFEAVIDEGGYITADHFGKTRFPAALIGVAEKGCSYYRLTAEGKSGHSSMPPRHTAVGILAEAVCRVEAAPMGARVLDTVREHLILSAPAMPLGKRFAVANLHFTSKLLFRIFRDDTENAPMFRTTFACTQLSGSEAPNILPGKAECIVNARILQGDTPESVRAHLEGLVKDLPVKVEPILEIPASVITPTDSEVYGKLREILTSKYPTLTCIPGIQAITTDSRHYEGVCGHIFKFMPFIMDAETYARMHSAGERLRTDSLVKAIELYKKIIREM